MRVNCGQAFRVQHETVPVFTERILTMKATDVSQRAREMFEALGPKAIAEAAQKAVACEAAGDKEQAKIWRRIETALMELRGPREG